MRHAIDMRLLPQECEQRQFKQVRPITILPSAMQIGSRIMFKLVASFDSGGRLGVLQSPT